MAKTKQAARAIQPSLESLRFFEELGRRIPNGRDSPYKSLRELASEMPYAVSFVFRALQELERYYGRQLVNRASVQLNDAGKACYDYAASVLAAHADGRQWPILHRERVVIGTTNRLLNFLLPAAVAAYRRQFDTARGRTAAPVDLRFREYDFEEMIDDLRRGDIHAGVSGLPFTGQWSDVSHEVVWRGVPTVMIAASGHPRWGAKARTRREQPVSLREVAGETVCALERDLYGVLAALPRPADTGSRILVDNYTSVVAIVRTGAAVGFVPAFGGRVEDGRFHESGLVCYPVADPEVALRDLAVWRRAGDDLPRPVEAFLEEVRAALKPGPAAGSGG